MWIHCFRSGLGTELIFSFSSRYLRGPLELVATALNSAWMMKVTISGRNINVLDPCGAAVLLEILFGSAGIFGALGKTVYTW